MTTTSAHDIARELRERLPGIGVTKLHKLLYYCQGWHAAWTGEPMFGEEIEAWDMGPVVADLWHDEDKDREPPEPSEVTDSARATISYVVTRYGQLSGKDLIRLTHNEAPWRDVSEDPFVTTIDLKALGVFFSSDEGVSPVIALANAALQDAEVRKGVEEHAARMDEEAPRPDDLDEIMRRMAAL